MACFVCCIGDDVKLNGLRCWADILGTTVLHVSVLDFMLHILVMHFGENSDALK